MKNFIEVTSRVSKNKILVNIAHIQYVTSASNLATIHMSGINISVDARETYEQVVALIQDALRE